MKTMIISWLVALLPILSICKSPISGLDLGTFSTIIVAFVFLLKRRRLCTRRKYIFNYFILYILLITIINILIGSSSSANYASPTLTMLRLGKVVLVLLLFFSFNLIGITEYKCVINAIDKIVFVNVGFIVVQRLFYQLLGTPIANPISFLATNEAYNGPNYTMLIGSYLRPSGFFFEPSHFSQYCSLYLCFLLFGEKSINVKKVIFVALGIMLSGSGMGILMLVALLGVSLVLRFHKRILTSFMYIGAFAIILFYMSKSSFVQTMLDRVFSDGAVYGGNAIEARIGNGYRIYQSLNLINKLFGCGYGHVPNGVYLNGLAYLLNTLGLFGSTLFFFVCNYVFIRTKTWARWSILCYLVLLVGAQVFTPALIVYFLGVPLVYSLYTDDAYEVRNKDLALKQQTNENVIN